MQEPLSRHISNLKLSPSIQSNNLLINQLSDIDKYFEDERAKAYLLGQLFRNSSNNIVWMSVNFQAMLQYLEKERLASYFEGQSKMPRSTKEIRTWVIFLFAVLSILLGTFRLLANSVEVGLSGRYNVPIVVEGGLPLIAGLLLLIPAFSRWRHSRRRKQLVSRLTELPK